MGGLFSRIWKTSVTQHDIENGLIRISHYRTHEDEKLKLHEQTPSDVENNQDEITCENTAHIEERNCNLNVINDEEEMISYPDIITVFNFQYYFKMKTKKEPEGLHWNLFMQYDILHTQTISFADFLNIVE